MRIKTESFIGIIALVLFWSTYCFAQGFDDPFTKGVNEGAIGSGFDDPFTKGVNEGAIGSGFDDPFTKGINECAIG